jgi:hypothetical protein
MEVVMHRRRPGLCHVIGVLLTASIGARASADVNGRAYACYANLPSLGVTATTHGDSGWLNLRSGGSRSSSRSNVSYGDVLHVDEMESESHGDNCKGHNHNSLSAGWILKGSLAEVRWTHIESDDDDACCKPHGPHDLKSVVEGLTFGGRRVTVTGGENQTLTIPGRATLILNEVRRGSDGDCDDDDVEHHALHLILNNGNEVILAASKFDRDGGCCRTTPTRTTTWGAVKVHYR